jgi:predicted O-methyltransferase YrrM
VEGNARETLPAIGGSFDVVFIDAWKDDYEWYFGEARTKLEPGGIVVADNVATSPVVQAYAEARQADPTLVSVTVPLGNGLEVTTILR